MAAGNQGRDASGAQLRVEAHVPAQTVRRREVGRSLSDRLHVRRGRSALESTELGETRASGCGEHHRKLEGLQTAETACQLIYGVIRTRKRAMSAGAAGLQREGDVSLLAGSYFIKLTFAVL